MTDVQVRYTGSEPKTLPTLALEVEHGAVITVPKETAGTLPPDFKLVTEKDDDDGLDEQPEHDGDAEPQPGLEPVIDPELAKAAGQPRKRASKRTARQQP